MVQHIPVGGFFEWDLQDNIGPFTTSNSNNRRLLDPTSWSTIGRFGNSTPEITRPVLETNQTREPISTILPNKALVSKTVSEIHEPSLVLPIKEDANKMSGNSAN